MDAKTRDAITRAPIAEGSISADWQSFEASLAQVLEALREDQYLVVSVKRSGRYVQFAAGGRFGLRAEAVSNGYLSRSERLGDEQVAALEALGWQPPTGAPDEATPVRQPQGSPNFYRDWSWRVPFDEVAHLAVRTLVEVLRVPHPRFLQYQAFDADGSTVLLPTLGLARARPRRKRAAQPAAPTAETVRDQVLALARRLTGNDGLDPDEDGDIPLAINGVAGFVRVNPSPLFVRVYCLPLAKVEADEALMRRLHEINARTSLGRLVLVEGFVFAVVDLLPSPAVADHVVQAYAVLSALVGAVAEELPARFGHLAGTDAAPGGVLKN